VLFLRNKEQTWF